MRYHTNILTCLNPKDKVDGKNVHALIFKYSPIHTDFLEVNCTVLELVPSISYVNVYVRLSYHYFWEVLSIILQSTAVVRCIIDRL